MLTPVLFLRTEYVIIDGRAMYTWPGQLLDVETPDAKSFVERGSATYINPKTESANVTKAQTSDSGNNPAGITRRNEDVPKTRQRRRKRASGVNNKSGNKKTRSRNR